MAVGTKFVNTVARTTHVPTIENPHEREIYVLWRLIPTMLGLLVLLEGALYPFSLSFDIPPVQVMSGVAVIFIVILILVGFEVFDKARTWISKGMGVNNYDAEFSDETNDTPALEALSSRELAAPPALTTPAQVIRETTFNANNVYALACNMVTPMLLKWSSEREKGGKVTKPWSFDYMASEDVALVKKWSDWNHAVKLLDDAGVIKNGSSKFSAAQPGHELDGWKLTLDSPVEILSAIDNAMARGGYVRIDDRGWLKRI